MWIYMFNVGLNNYLFFTIIYVISHDVTEHDYFQNSADRNFPPKFRAASRLPVNRADYFLLRSYLL